MRDDAELFQGRGVTLDASQELLDFGETAREPLTVAGDERRERVGGGHDGVPSGP